MPQDVAEGSFEPFNDAHAIVSAQITLTYAAPLNEEQWARVVPSTTALARKLKLPTPQPFYGFSVTFEQARVSMNINAPSPVPGEIHGLSFTQLDETDQIAERIVVARDQLTVATGAYVRWAPFRKRAETILSGLADLYTSEVGHSGTKLEYWDRFDHSGSGAPDSTSVVNPNSDWVVRGAIRPTEMWHSYSGAFDRLNDHTRRLTGVRIDCADFPLRTGAAGRSIVIHTALQDSVNAPGVPVG